MRGKAVRSRWTYLFHLVGGLSVSVNPGEASEQGVKDTGHGGRVDGGRKKREEEFESLEREKDCDSRGEEDETNDRSHVRVVKEWIRKGQEYFTVDKLVQVDVYQASRESG